MQRFEAIIFDLDGTLANTLQDIAEATNWALAQLGLPTHSVDKYRYMIGDGRHLLCKRALPEGSDSHTIKRLEELMSSYYKEHLFDNTKLYPGVYDLLEKLDKTEIKMAVLSNKPDRFVKMIVERLCSGISFDVVMGQQDNIARKPSPEGALYIARLLDLSPDRFIYVGDTAIDMETARAAGMFPVGVSWGFRDRQELTLAGAKIIIDNPLQLYKFIMNGA